MKQLLSKILNALRFMMGLWLVLNVSIATIPRCDQVMDLFRHTVPSSEFGLPNAHCDERPSDPGVPHYRGDTFCKCSLAQFMAVKMPSVCTQAVITQAARMLHLIEFPYDLSPSDLIQRPSIPPPRRISAIS